MENVVARNKKAAHDYFILDRYECGIVLTGTEIKSVRGGKVSLQDAYCRVKNNELFVINMHIAKYEQGNIFNHVEKRDRKLLVHKSEIRKIAGRVQKEGLTLIPLTLYFVGGLAKLEIALCRGKKLYDKREDLRKAAVRQEIEKANKFKGRR
ncbi:MAG: SsrA-binding protein SmpB [Bacilli bacterium]|nr:SsrA-binding protein SmpB [Bacilli bacterium]MDD4077636.1 SsrA-binding protein SmpB [Bacilli bacterium]MDD4387907.1 SsrA-binding protein SmpB [Bacilli bacterium]